MEQTLALLFIYLCLCRLLSNADASDISGVKSVLNAEEIQIMLERHNNFRRMVSPTASNMRALSWNDKLANLAQEYSNKCVFKHSENKVPMEPYGDIAESIYIGNERSDVFSRDDVARPVIAWYNETKFYNYNRNLCQTGQICGHYTQAVWAKTYKIGCGRTRCNQTIIVDGSAYLKPLIVVCKYGPAGNIKSIFGNKPRRPFKRGNWCSRCPSEAPFCYDKLCDVERDLNVVTATTTDAVGATTSTSTAEELLVTTESSLNHDHSTDQITKSLNASDVISRLSPVTVLSDGDIDYDATKAVTLPGIEKDFEIPDEIDRKPVLVKFFIEKKDEVFNERPMQRSTIEHIKVERSGLKCFVCEEGSSVSQCRSNNQTIYCNELSVSSEIAGSDLNDWSCITYYENDKVKMKCMSTPQCEVMKNDTAAKAKCCRTDLCNNARISCCSTNWLCLLLTVLVMMVSRH